MSKKRPASSLTMSQKRPAAPAVKRPNTAVAAAPTVAALAPQAMPVDPQYGADVNAAQLGLTTTLQQNQAARGQLGQNYGFGVDAGGNVIDDPTNPYSQAMALQHAYEQRGAGIGTSYAARGQLYAGSLQVAKTENERSRLAGRDALIRNFMQARTRLDQGDTAAQNAYANAVSAAHAAEIARALEQRPDPGSVPAASAGVAARAATRRPVPKASHKRLKHKARR